ncbi:MAG: GNAT family N-acetyltransferase [Candidatus Heimdallarchaeota archaeon]|nr:GNAT family N-acetyltransferase [Candidatus Heimdallarchaeota archaeon]
MIQFRQFKKEDWEDFTKLNTEAFPIDNMKKEIYLNSLDNEGFVGAYRDDNLIGFLILRIMGNYAHLGQIAVAERERGRGYGKQLMDYSINFFKEKNTKTVGLYVETKNDIALNLYHKYGFTKKYESWHYWINEEQVKELEDKDEDLDAAIRVLKQENYETIVNVFSQINVEELKTHLEKYQQSPVNTSIPVGLHVNGQLKVYGRTL